MPSELVERWLAEERRPFTGWDFSALAGRLIEEDPPWSYMEIVRQQLPGASSLIDLGTGGGEVFAELRDAYPPRVVATEAYAPNVEVARRRLATLGVEVVRYEATDNGAQLPFLDLSFDVVLSRHEAYTASEVARILTRGGRFVTQQVTGTSSAELLAEFDETPHWPHVTADRLAAELRAAGLTVDDVRDWTGTQRFKDVGALVYWLKAIPWEVPGFSVARDRDVLLRLQRRLERDGQLTFSIGRLLIVAHKPHS